MIQAAVRINEFQAPLSSLPPPPPPPPPPVPPAPSSKEVTHITKLDKALKVFSTEHNTSKPRRATLVDAMNNGKRVNIRDTNAVRIAEVDPATGNYFRRRAVLPAFNFLTTEKSEWKL